MNLPKSFLSLANFELAFRRIVRGGNKEYKQFYRHLFASYSLALEENLLDLIDDLRRGRFEPDTRTLVYQPKKSGVLRPITILSLRDLIVYQALLNRIASFFAKDQEEFALKRSFGALFAGKSSDFFYRSWRNCYSAYSKALISAYKSGYNHLADFDLVSFYELIDHHLLRNCLKRRVKDEELLDLLLKCLKSWASGSSGAQVLHGVPQGPEPSAFLAECLLFQFDELKLKEVKYFRYIDDIKMMARSEVPLRRALIRLDLESKCLGLVPQAQKIECRKVTRLRDLLKTLPSGLTDLEAKDQSKPISQRRLLQALVSSLKKEGKRWVIDDVTRFKFAINRLKPRLDVLRRISPFLVRRPDLSWTLANYAKKFPENVVAANALLNALKQDPAYDAAAANFIDAMNVCEPPNNNTAFRRVIQTANRRSEERSILIRIASLSFRGRRSGVSAALSLIEKEKSPIVKSIVLHRLFGQASDAPFTVGAARSLLEPLTQAEDPDLARFCAGLLLETWPWFAKGAWVPPRTANRSVQLLKKGLGLRARVPAKEGVLDRFFKIKFKIAVPISWRKALGRDLRETERRCLQLQQFLIGNPTVRVTYLDTFNEILVQAFSANLPALTAAYTKAIPAKNKIPDYGAWLGQANLGKVVPTAARWFVDVHAARVRGELAHARAKKTGAFTRPISFWQAEQLVKRAQRSWAELIGKWKSIL